MIAVAALCGSLLAWQDVAVSDDQWATEAWGISERARVATPDEAPSIVAELEAAFLEFARRVGEPRANRLRLAEAAYSISIALSEVEEDLLGGLFDRAGWIERAKEAAQLTGRTEMIAAAFRRHARHLRAVGRSADALPVLDEARRLIDAQAPPTSSDAMWNARTQAERAAAGARLASERGEVLRRLGRHDDAGRVLDEALHLFDEAERHGTTERQLVAESGLRGQAWLDRERATLLVLRARCHGIAFYNFLDMGLREPAYLALLAEEELAAECGDPFVAAAAVVHRADLTIYKGDLRAAERLCAGVSEEPWFALLRRSEQAIYRWLGAKSRDKREWTEPDLPKAAVGMLEEVVSEGALIGVNQLYALGTLVRNRLRAGDLDGARRWLDAAQDEIARGERASDSVEFALHVHWLTALAAELAMAGGAPPDELAAVRAALEDSTRRFLGRWADVQVRPGGVGFLHHGRRSSSISALVDVTLATSSASSGAAAEAVEPLLEALSFGALARSFVPPGTAPPVPDLATIREELLPPGGGLLVYLSSEERTHVFAVDREDVLLGRGPPEHVVDALRGRLVSQLRRPPPREWRRVGAVEPALDEASAALADALLPEAIRARVASWDAVTICGTSTLGYVPFEVLRIDGGYLGDAMPVGYLGSPTLGLALLQRERDRPPRDADDRDVLLLAAPESAEGEERQLPWTDDLTEDLVGHYGRADVYLGREATLPRLERELRESRPALAHVVAHGVGEREAEANRALLLAPSGDGDGRLRHEDARELEAPSLVILSSCEAGRGRPRRGDDGIDDLGGAFLFAGAGAVVVSDHDIHFQATMELMARFHRELADGATPATALWHARRALARHEEYSHPYFRALVHVTGLGHRALFP